jgi:hypothetical protein
MTDNEATINLYAALLEDALAAERAAERAAVEYGHGSPEHLAAVRAAEAAWEAEYTDNPYRNDLKETRP